MKKAISFRFQPAGLVIGLLCALLFMSCVDEKILDLPPETVGDEFTSSTAIVSLLRAIEKEKINANSECFSVFYPLKLRFNNGLNITIDDFDGIKEVADNLTNGQHVDGLQFPFLVSKSDAIRTISDESTFIELLEDCDLVTLRDEFDHYFIQCFDFIYPIQMIDINENTVSIASPEEYFAFELLQGFDKQPRFIYPLETKYFKDGSLTFVEDDYELFEVFDHCVTCPNLFFKSNTLDSLRYTFIADFDGIDQLHSYDWYINGDKIETDGVGVQGDNLLDITFDKGTYEVCIKYSSSDDDCFAGVAYCETIVVKDLCPAISFETNQLTDFVYEFTANFEAKDLIEYTWVIYVGDDLIFFETEDEEGDNALEFNFDPGEYTVCVEAEPEGCPMVLKFCEEIIVP